MPALCVFCVMLRFKCPVLSAYSKKRPLYNCHNSIHIDLALGLVFLSYYVFLLE